MVKQCRLNFCTIRTRIERLFQVQKQCIQTRSNRNGNWLSPTFTLYRYTMWKKNKRRIRHNCKQKKKHASTKQKQKHPCVYIYTRIRIVVWNDCCQENDSIIYAIDKKYTVLNTLCFQQLYALENINKSIRRAQENKP